MGHDWVGIRSADKDPNRLPVGNDYVDSVWSRGTKDCLLGAPSRATVKFETIGLGPNKFRAYLIDEFTSKDTYQSDAMSLPFLVTRNCTGT